MRRLSVIIPSKTVSNFLVCAEAVRRNELPQVQIIVIDDGFGSLDFLPRPDLMPCYGITGEKPFIFSRNINAGINAAKDDDVVLLNDDAILETLGGLTMLQEAAEADHQYGLIAAVTNSVGNMNQERRTVGLRSDPRQVCFICVLIPRRTIDTVGLLDERFTAYGFEDDDYCYRVRQAGMKLGIHDGCFVDHLTLPSTFRTQAHPGLNVGRQIFIDKWGSYPL